MRYLPNPAFNPVLLPYDLTRGGGDYNYFGHADIKELSLYIEDSIKAGNWLFNLGIRGDLYNGLASASQAEPRLGISYSVKPTNTVLRISYARTLETPFNENLVLSSQGCANEVLSPLLSCTPGVQGTLEPGFRNEFHAGLQQAFGKNIVFSGEYIWKYTHNAFDFSVLGNTPITFPIHWHNAKVPGFALRTDVPNFHHVSAFVVMSSVAPCFLLFRRRSLEPGPRSDSPDTPSESIMMNGSIKPRTCSINCPFTGARGLASTGVTTAAWSPERRPVTTRSPTIRTPRVPTPQPHSTGSRRST